MYVVESELWLHVASMRLEGTATRWFQSVERKICHLSWEGFSALVHGCFDIDQHELLMRQMFHIHQSSSVAEYVE
jgi:hypothetical protein